MDRKLIQRERMMNYFIDAACRIIREEGLKEVTVRKVADIAGYHYATIYNYFKDLPHLILHASFRLQQEYYDYIIAHIGNQKNFIESYLRGWESFCRYGLENPKIFNCLFVESYGDIPLEEIFDLLGASPLLQSRGERIANGIAAGVLPKDRAGEIDDLVMSLCVGSMMLCLTMRLDYSKEEIIRKNLDNIRMIFNMITC